MQTNKQKIIKLVAIFVVIALFAVLSVAMYQASLTKVPSKFTTARDNNGGLNPMASYDLEAVKKSYQHFSLSNAQHLVKVKFISREDRAYYVGDDGYMLFITEEENKDEYGKPKYQYIEDVVLTLEVQTAYWGKLQKGDTIKVVFQSMVSDLAGYVEDAKEVVIAINRARQEKEEIMYGIYYGYEGMLYLDKGRVYPSFDMTYEEVYGLKGLGNPVGKYMGMKEKDFEKQMIALK